MKIAIHRGRLLATTAGALLASMSASPSAAQDAASPVPSDASATDQGDIQELVVTARRRDELLQDVPISIVAMNQEQLTNRGVNQITDLANIAPGFRAETVAFRPSALNVVIRGQRMYDNLPSQDSPTAIYFADALVAPSNGSNTALYDLASVQVLRGPQGTLFGRNTTGGALVITPARPELGEFTAEAKASYGNYDTVVLQGIVNIPVNDTLAIRLGGNYRNADGWQKSITPGHTDVRAGGGEATDLRGSILWTPTETLENYLIGTYGKQKNQGAPAQIVAVNPNSQEARVLGQAVFNEFYAGDPKKIYARYQSFENLERWSVSNTTSLELGNVTLKNIISYRWLKGDARFPVPGSDLPITDTSQDERSTTFSEELQVSASAFADRLTWVAGVYYVDLNSPEFRNSASTLNVQNLPSGVTFFSGSMREKSIAGYAQGTFKITDRLSLTAGGRYTKDYRYINWKHAAYPDPLFQDVLGIPFVPRCLMMDDAGVSLPISNCAIKSKVTYAKPTWDITLDYHFTPQTMVYASVRRGYRSGGFNFRAFNATQRQPFSPETVLDYEGGVKSTFSLGGVRVQFDGNFFYSKYDNLQRRTSVILPGNVLVPSIFNAAAGNVSGLEGSLVIKPTSNLTLSGNYSYITTKYTRFDQFVQGQLRDFSDRKFAGVPKNSWTANVSYELPLSDDVGRLTANVNVAHVGSSFVDDTYQSNQQLSVIYPNGIPPIALPPGDRAFKLRAYTMTNARLAWNEVLGRPLDLALFMNNVFDVAAEVAVSPGYAAIGHTGIGFAPPRMFGAERTYRFR